MRYLTCGSCYKGTFSNFFQLFMGQYFYFHPLFSFTIKIIFQWSKFVTHKPRVEALAERAYADSS